MSSWTNKDLYVASGFGSSNVNGYYFTDTTENWWVNNLSSNYVLVYGGTHWWFREKVPSSYTHYYYGAEDNGSGICDGLIFASNSVYGTCEGLLPIGNVIYGGELLSSSSSSSSEGYVSSSSSGLENYAMINLAQDYYGTGTYAMVNLDTGELSYISSSRGFGDITLRDVNTMYGTQPSLGIFKICDNGSTISVFETTQIGGWACVFSDTSYEAIPGFYVGSGYSIVKRAIGTWEAIGGGNPSFYPAGLAIHNGIMYAIANPADPGAKKLFRITFNPFTETVVCDLPVWMKGISSINGSLYSIGLDTDPITLDAYNGIYTIDVDTGTFTLKGRIESATAGWFSRGIAPVPVGFPDGVCSYSSEESNSYTSSSSSSSGSYIPENNRELFHVLVNQGHHDLLPFSFITERGQESNVSADTTFGFIYTQKANKLNYNSLLSFNTVSPTTTSTFVPEDEDAKYKHEPIFYADIIAEGQGVNEYSLRSQDYMYVKEKPTTVFNIPKFSWDNSIFGDSNVSSEESIDVKEGHIWIGTNDKFIKKVYYSSDSASLVSAYNAPSEVYTMCFGQQDNKAFVSCYDHLVIYTATSYYSGDDDFHEEYKILNNNNDLMVLDDSQSGYLISTESYQGNVIFRNRNTLDIINTYGGFDAPFKVLWSKAHNCYLVAGTHTLWKLDNGQKTAVYNIKGYSIVDFDCSEKGIVGIIFKGSDYIIRFLSKNLYTMLYTESVTDKNVRYCKYCEQGRFYILQEIVSESDYSTVSYLFDSENVTLAKTNAESSIVTTTTTTTLPTPAGKIEIIEPVSTTVWQKGNSYNIVWARATESNPAELVKIELYNGIALIDTLAPQTNNTGLYVWDIATTYDNGSNYKVKVTWLAAGDTTQFDTSDAFTLTDVPITTTTTTTKILDSAIGVEYNRYTEQVIVVLSNGLIGIYDLSDNSFNGMFDSEVRNAKCIGINDRKIRQFKGVSKVRVYVGSEPHLSDLWDSGIIDTTLTSIYYGGKTLTPGNEYIVNVQVYSDKYGWSSTQSKTFVMPK